MYLDTIKKFSLYESPPPPDPAVPDPEDPAAPPGGGGGGDPPPPAVPTISADILPDDLKGLPEAEVKFHLNRMVDGLRSNNERVRELEGQLRTAQTPVAPVEPAKPVRPLEELILDDPEEAIMQVMEKRGLTSRFDRMETQVGESAFNIVGSGVDDFAEHEADVRQIMADSKVPSTVEHITGALQMVIGRKAMEERGRAARAAASPDIPKPDLETPSPTTPELKGLEKEIQEASGMTPADYLKYKNTENFDIKVPTS